MYSSSLYLPLSLSLSVNLNMSLYPITIQLSLHRVFQLPPSTPSHLLTAALG